jgi:FkbM family methyltransferase
MTQVLYSQRDVKYIKWLINDTYEVLVPEFQRKPNGRGTLDYEPERTASMEKHLKQGDVLFDIGVADGWESVIYSQFVGPENMCLFEPSSTVWTNIRSTWEANGCAPPRSAFWGFVSDKTQLVPLLPCINDETLEYKNGWPLSAYRDTMIEEMCFRSLISTANNIPQTTVDDFVTRTNIAPKGMSIDVEGAELLVLKGAEQTLRRSHPLIWLSLHDLSGAIDYDYHTTKEEIFGFLTACGYNMTWLEDYGDSHWLCESF